MAIDDNILRKHFPDERLRFLDGFRALKLQGKNENFKESRVRTTIFANKQCFRLIFLGSDTGKRVSDNSYYCVR